MIMTNFAQRLKSVNFFQTTKFSNIDISFSRYIIDVCTNFRSYFSEEIFLSSLSEWLSVQVCVLFKKKKTQTDQSNQNQNRKQNAKQTKMKYLHNIQG
jgi:hypothetical protein